MTIKIGADVTYSWDDEPDAALHGYISFSDWEDDAEFDSFGIRDMDVFFYSSEVELPALMEKGNGHDFQVKSFEYRLLTVVDE